jgi:hypothetical protein
MFYRKITFEKRYYTQKIHKQRSKKTNETINLPSYKNEKRPEEKQQLKMEHYSPQKIINGFINKVQQHKDI